MNAPRTAKPGRDALAPAESSQLAELEAVVDRGLETFVEVANALREIRDSRLYRATHRTFETYCRDRFEMSRRHANRLVQAAQVVGVLGPAGPTVERVARELAPLLDKPKELHRVWTEAQAIAEQEGRPLTADLVRRERENAKVAGRSRARAIRAQDRREGARGKVARLIEDERRRLRRDEQAEAAFLIWVHDYAERELRKLGLFERYDDGLDDEDDVENEEPYSFLDQPGQGHDERRK